MVTAGYDLQNLMLHMFSFRHYITITGQISRQRIRQYMDYKRIITIQK